MCHSQSTPWYCRSLCRTGLLVHILALFLYSRKKSSLIGRFCVTDLAGKKLCIHHLKIANCLHFFFLFPDRHFLQRKPRPASSINKVLCWCCWRCIFNRASSSRCGAASRPLRALCLMLITLYSCCHFHFVREEELYRAEPDYTLTPPSGRPPRPTNPSPPHCEAEKLLIKGS